MSGNRACRHLSDSEHVRDAGLKAAPDTDVWNYARNNGFMIVSKDSDFHQRSPPIGFTAESHLDPIGKLLDDRCRPRPP